MRTTALETYKIVNKSSPEFLHNLITLKENSYNFRYKLTVELPRPRTIRYSKKSFSYGRSQRRHGFQIGSEIGEI
jgi:hypothetical protein